MMEAEGAVPDALGRGPSSTVVTTGQWTAQKPQ
jgi:hypothetical protein